MKQSCPSLALVELLLTTHLLETSAASATLVDFIAVSALIVFMGDGVPARAERDSCLGSRWMNQGWGTSQLSGLMGHLSNQPRLWLLLLHPFNSLFSRTTSVSWHHSRFYWSKRWWGGSDISWTICTSFTPHSRQITTTPQQFYGPFSGTTLVSRCQKRTSGLCGAGED